MIGPRCFTLESGITGDDAFLQASPGGPVDILLTDEIGSIIQISDAANFPDAYYRVLTGCSSVALCPDCYNADPIDYSNNAANIRALNTTVFPSPTAAYVLVKCGIDVVFTNPETINQSPDTALVTSTDLSMYVNMVVNIVEYPNTCYTVLGPYTRFTGCPCEYYTVTGAFVDCECCLPAPGPAPYVQSIQRPVNVFYHVTDSECEVRDNTRFAENYYRLFTGIRYGIKNCCGDVDFEKLWIKKELSDYSRINPPVTCAPPAVEICPEPCPAPDPIGCDPALDVSATGGFN